MKILYIGNYRDGTGWSHAAQNNILALNEAGIKVVPRCIRMNQSTPVCHEKIRELEQENSSDCDIVIQQVLPHYLEYRAGVKNIAYCMFETSNFSQSSWASHINLMDELWVPSKHNFRAAKESGVNIPIKIIPIPNDMSYFHRSYENLQLPCDKDDFIFYTIGEFSKRKNVAAIVRAFHTEFDKNEPVQLLIKTTPQNLGDNPPEAITNFLNDIKNGMKIFSKPEMYKKEMVIPEYVNDEVIARIHLSAHCFVSASLGEAWCIPAMTALGFGRPVIVPYHTGFMEYVDMECGEPVMCYRDSCFGAVDTFGDIYTAKEDWFIMPIPALRESMRAMFESRNQEKFQKMSFAAIRKAEEFSLLNVGNKMKEILC